MYATQRPSGEKAPHTSRDGVRRNSAGGPGLFRRPPSAGMTGATQRSLLVCGSVL